MKFRKKPAVVDAIRVSDVLLSVDRDRLGALPDWIGDAMFAGTLFVVCGQVRIKTLEGVMVALEADWIIRGIAGELYPCKPDIFEATYEPVGDGLAVSLEQ